MSVTNVYLGSIVVESQILLLSDLAQMAVARLQSALYYQNGTLFAQNLEIASGGSLVIDSVSVLTLDFDLVATPSPSSSPAIDNNAHWYEGSLAVMGYCLFGIFVLVLVVLKLVVFKPKRKSKRSKFAKTSNNVLFSEKKPLHPEKTKKPSAKRGSVFRRFSQRNSTTSVTSIASATGEIAWGSSKNPGIKPQNSGIFREESMNNLEVNLEKKGNEGNKSRVEAGMQRRDFMVFDPSR